ncbi:methyltransferase family protein [Oceanisphaera avium]|uniref:S-isoprenylcysteine methyltransferase n=1 Tax=Oceanisphaera avium TaxID=1903694 RepID=A0A1Y0CTV4_9GAMM|nr:methyltransferase [Oceanisphaera avium]ART78773.1 hypothetical protein CBP12_00245 [Oceanisphaera avium]
MSKGSTLLWLPPPLIMAISAGLMWLTQRYWQHHSVVGFSWHFKGQTTIALLLAIAALLLMAVAARTMHQARTTLLPFEPLRATSLVTQGIFSYSRNPIYLADALLLFAWLLWLGLGINLGWFALFLLYMTVVQIKAEERALTEKFAHEYLAYCHAVRRWL